jgi:transketolase
MAPTETVTTATRGNDRTVAADRLCIDTIRTLAMDAVQQANSGHPGTPMALAPVVYCLWQRFLRFDPAHPIWPNRDRFVLSVGHASTLLYAMLQWELFERHCRDSPGYREQVLPEAVVARVSVEKGSTLGWARYVGAHGCPIGMETFGASAPLKALQQRFGFTPERVVAAAREQVAACRSGTGGRRVGERQEGSS